MQRVVVTGLGMINAVGNNAKESFHNIIAGKSGVDTISHFDASEDTVQIAAEVNDFNPLDVLDAKEIKKCDRFVHLGLYAAKEALIDANIDLVNIDYNRIGVSGATGIGGLPSIQENAEKNAHSKKVSPFFIPGSITNILSGYIAIKYGLKGPNLSSTTACTAGLHAINEATKTIMIGGADGMLVVGSEACICELGIRGFSAMKALSRNNENPQCASRPFDKNRDGFVMGEGAGALMLESESHALARGAKIYATIEGFGESADAGHITAPNEDGATRAIKAALDMADHPKIDYVNAHGTSTPLGDVNETNVIKGVFGNKIPPISSIKGATGHCLGATGSIEAVVSIMALINDVMPPTINLVNKDINCDIDYVANKARYKNLDIVMSTNYGFGGTNGAIIFKKYKG